MCPGPPVIGSFHPCTGRSTKTRRPSQFCRALFPSPFQFRREATGVDWGGWERRRAGAATGGGSAAGSVIWVHCGRGRADRRGGEPEWALPAGAKAASFRYKICFIALDGTDEAEMICFGDIGRRIIGKSVQQVLRTATSSNTYPADILKMVSLRFTFAVTLTQQSYYHERKTYQVGSIITLHGQHAPAPGAMGAGGSSAPQLQISASTDTTGGSETASPTHVIQTTIQSAVLQSTPPQVSMTARRHHRRTTKGLNQTKESLLLLPLLFASDSPWMVLTVLRIHRTTALRPINSRKI